MKRTFLGRGRFANVTSTLALVIALGGTSYAAITITGKNIRDGSIRNRDLGRNSIDSSKVKDGSLRSRDFRQGQLPRGAAGPPGPKGDPGPKGADGGFASQLGSGQTLRGHLDLVSVGDFAGDLTTMSVSFAAPLAAAPAPHFIESGTPPPAGCAGGSAANPTADPGHLCVYEVSGQFDGEKRLTPSRFGFGAELLSTALPAMGTRFFTTATWAATAP